MVRIVVCMAFSLLLSLGQLPAQRSWLGALSA